MADTFALSLQSKVLTVTLLNSNDSHKVKPNRGGQAHLVFLGAATGSSNL